MARARLGLGRLGSVKIVSLASTIKTALTGNVNFASPNPSVAVLGGGIDAASAKIIAYDSAKAAADTALAERNAAVAAVAALLTQEAAYVDNMSGGDAAKIESAGMSVRAPKRPVGRLERVLKLVVAEGANEGTLAARWKRTRGARSYEVQTTADAETESSWVFRMSAVKGKAIIEGLAGGARVWVRVRAIGAHNQHGPWSDPAVKTVP